MSCAHWEAIDWPGFLEDPRAQAFAAFRAHYPGCAFCSAEVRAWTELHLRLSSARPSAHPREERLLAYESAPHALAEEERRAIESHLAGCPACREELVGVRGFPYAPDPLQRAAPVRIALRSRAVAALARLRQVLAHPALGYALALLLLIPLVRDRAALRSPPPAAEAPRTPQAPLERPPKVAQQAEPERGPQPLASAAPGPAPQAPAQAPAPAPAEAPPEVVRRKAVPSAAGSGSAAARRSPPSPPPSAVEESPGRPEPRAAEEKPVVLGETVPDSVAERAKNAQPPEAAAGSGAPDVSRYEAESAKQNRAALPPAPEVAPPPPLASVPAPAAAGASTKREDRAATRSEAEPSTPARETGQRVRIAADTTQISAADARGPLVLLIPLSGTTRADGRELQVSLRDPGGRRELRERLAVRAGETAVEFRVPAGWLREPRYLLELREENPERVERRELAVEIPAAR